MSAPVSAIRPAILAEVAVRPGQTAYEVAAALGYRKQDRVRVASIIGGMWRSGMLATGTTFRPRQGRPVRTFYPAAASPPQLVRRRPAPALRRSALARLRPAGPVMSVAESALAACRHADPVLFFGRDSEPEDDRSRRVAEAKEVCFACPVRVACLNSATARRELWGIWGGADFETGRVQRSTQTTRPDVAASSRA
jgi:WhiB family transcriptional regulator, redox-sensing transcriptional regulator